MDKDKLISEIIKMKDFFHPNIMPLIGVCLDAGTGVSMVMPYMVNGSLLDYVKKERTDIGMDMGSGENKVYNVKTDSVVLQFACNMGRLLIVMKLIHRHSR